jgi:hypothetical protein
MVDLSAVENLCLIEIKSRSSILLGHAVAQQAEALRCKPEDRGFDSR